MSSSVPDRLILICLDVASPTKPVPGSIVVPCTGCDALVWLSPSSRPVMDRATILCPVCGGSAAREARHAGEPLQFGGLLKGQLDEIREGLNDDP